MSSSQVLSYSFLITGWDVPYFSVNSSCRSRGGSGVDRFRFLRCSGPSTSCWRNRRCCGSGRMMQICTTAEFVKYFV